MNINDIFTIEQYDEAYEFVATHEHTSIEDLGNDKYKIIEIPQPTEEEKEKAEQERIAHLSLTRGDVFRGLYKAKKITRDKIRALISENTVISEDEKELALIDFDESLNFYRGIKLIDIIGLQLHIHPTQLTKFFETNDYNYLITK